MPTAPTGVPPSTPPPSTPSPPLSNGPLLRVAVTPAPDPNLHSATPPTAVEPQSLAPTTQMPPTTTRPPLRLVDTPNTISEGALCHSSHNSTAATFRQQHWPHRMSPSSPTPATKAPSGSNHANMDLAASFKAMAPT
jgi:hypothetical protein